MLRFVVVWYLAGDDVEMSSDGHENRKLEGDAGGRAQRIPPQGVRSVKALEPKTGSIQRGNPATHHRLKSWSYLFVLFFLPLILPFFLSFFSFFLSFFSFFLSFFSFFFSFFLSFFFLSFFLSFFFFLSFLLFDPVLIFFDLLFFFDPVFIFF